MSRGTRERRLTQRSGEKADRRGRRERQGEKSDGLHPREPFEEIARHVARKRREARGVASGAAVRTSCVITSGRQRNRSPTCPTRWSSGRSTNTSTPSHATARATVAPKILGPLRAPRSPPRARSRRGKQGPARPDPFAQAVAGGHAARRLSIPSPDCRHQQRERQKPASIA